jgi:transcriptional regulator with XRE-family HTH domain
MIFNASGDRRMRKSVHSTAQKQLLVLLRNQRKKRGLTQTEVAEMLGRPQSFVAKYERGERRLDVLEFIVVAKAIGADPIKMLKAVIEAGG